MSRIGRNDPCFCGSGKKFKKCHGSVEGALEDNSAEDPIYRKVELPHISTPADISPYLEALTSSFSLFSVPRIEALLHVCRAVEINHAAIEFATAHQIEPGYQSLRGIQDLLRYLLYEIDKRCPEGGTVRSTRPNELSLAGRTAMEFSNISNLRDLDLMVRYNWGTAEILTDRKVVRFAPEKSALVDVAHEYEKFTGRAERLTPALQSVDIQSLKQSSKLLLRSVRLSTDASLIYSTEPEIVRGFYKAAEASSSQILTGGLLPEGWNIGSYSLSDYHALYHLLQARCLINTFAVKKALSSRRLSQPPYNSAALLLSREEITRDAEEIGGLAKGVTEEIIRDLTYNPREVPWTEVTYQPLIPLQGNLFAVVPIVVEGSSFDRNLLALIDRLPWRKAAAENLKADRENEMLRQIEPLLQGCGFAVASRVGLGERKARISDIDVLAWPSDGQSALAISLKWLYGPDSLQEVYNHSQRYQKALTTHRNNTEYLQKNAATIWSNNRLTPPLSLPVKILPALVTFQDELLEKDRVTDIPAVTLPQFIVAIAKCEGSLEKLYDSLGVISARLGPEPVERTFEPLKVGTYTFEVPVSYF
jgi:hypothetical protein